MFHETCYICGYQIDPYAKGLLGPSQDHVTPRSKGGRNIGNLRTVHSLCNSYKSDDTLDEDAKRYIRLQVKLAMRDEDLSQKRLKSSERKISLRKKINPPS